jgi:coenzyme F420-reducing hydrogenase delta subunit
MLPPSFVDFMARQPQVSAVIVSGCHPEACAQRLGSRWVEERMTGARDPHLRTSAGQAKVALCWAGPFELQRVSQQLAEMQVNQSDVAPQPAASGARHS